MEQGVRWLKVREAAELLRVRPETIYRWAYRGLLPHVKIGHSVRIDSIELERLLKGLPPPAVREPGR